MSQAMIANISLLRSCEILTQLAYYNHFVPPGLLLLVRNLLSIQCLFAQLMRPTAHHNLTVGFLCSLVLVCLGCKPALALDPGRDLSQFNRQIWLTENGLPQNTVHSITQARDGYVWLATEEGLARFDGIRFTVFDKQNTPELRSNDIRVLLEDRGSALWIGTADGLVRLRDGKFKAFTTQDG